VTTQQLEGRKTPVRPPVAPVAPPTPKPERSPELVWRIRRLAICLVLTAFAFNSSSGAQVPDTKLDLIVDPAGFLARALHMWDPQGFAGQVQNQAYGYLFPMGPFFTIGHAAGVPMWAVQRLWWSALLCTAFLGVVSLARRMRIGTPAARVVGGLAYALSPHVLSVLGPLSAEALPMCVAPWVLVPLVSAARDGSPRRAAMRSGVAVLCMGAINAALVFAALIPTVLWFVTRRPDRRLVRLGGAWVLAVVLATSWWVVPLLLFGRDSVPFLGHIEAPPLLDGRNMVMVLGPTKNAGVARDAKGEDEQSGGEEVQADGGRQGPPAARDEEPQPGEEVREAEAELPSSTAAAG